jgi:16S rRNA (adenine1518-N6/adenine1519-N6)-dimethyltransferase
LHKRRALGQHTIIDSNILAKIIQVSQINKNEIFYEAGTGHGTITKELCKYAKSVISFEIDNELFEKAKNMLSQRFSNLKVVNADIFRLHNLHFDVFISNLPYSRSKEAFHWLAFQKFNRAIVTVQKEFADKLGSNPGEENFRAITVITQHCFIIEELFQIGRQSFFPEPLVESKVIKLIPKNVMVSQRLIRNLDLLFSQRNRRASSVLRKYGIEFEFDNMRIDELNVADLIRLADTIKV